MEWMVLDITFRLLKPNMRLNTSESSPIANILMCGGLVESQHRLSTPFTPLKGNQACYAVGLALAVVAPCSHQYGY